MRVIGSLALVVCALTGVAGCGGSTSCAGGTTTASSAPELLDPNHAPQTLQVTLPGAANGQIAMESVFNSFGCTGENKSLAINWTAGPANTQSYAIIIHDPDAPTGVGFFHWTVLDIPAGTTSLPLNASAEGLPEGAIQAHTDFGATGYGGPCPPPGSGPHRYIATVYAVDVPHLGPDANATPALLRFMLGQHAVALGRATATFERN